MNLEESDILKDVKYRRHRQELMYRIAHINRDKTKLLFQVIGQPHYTEVKDEDGIRRYYPEVKAEPNLFLYTCKLRSDFQCDFLLLVDVNERTS